MNEAVYVSLFLVVISLFNSSPSASSLVQQLKAREHISTFTSTLHLINRINHLRSSHTKCQIPNEIRGGDDDDLSQELKDIDWQDGNPDDPEKDVVLTEGDFSDCSYEYQEIKPELRLDPSAPPPVLGAQVLPSF